MAPETMRYESMQQAGQPQQSQQSRAELRERIREQVRQSVEQARIAQENAGEAQQRAAQAQDRAAAAQGGIPVPPPPPNVVVTPDGRVVVGGDVGPGGAGGAFGGEFGAGTQVVPPNVVPPEAVQITYAFFLTCVIIAIGIPLARAFARWLDRRTVAPVGMPADLAARLDRIETAVETVAVEVERISEGQRFSSRLLSELRATPQLQAVRSSDNRG